MTKREAVEILRHADTDSEVDPDDYLKAFDMAVDALERDADVDDYIYKLRLSVTETIQVMMLRHGVKVVKFKDEEEAKKNFSQYREAFRHTNPGAYHPDHNSVVKIVPHSESAIRENPALKVNAPHLPMADSPR